MNNLLNFIFERPEKFSKLGLGNDLLNEFFDGNHNYDTLIPLLQSDNKIIVKEGLWILSELDYPYSEKLINFVLRIDADDLETKYYILEIIFLGSQHKNFEYFEIIIKALTNEDESLRILAMRLISNATNEQIWSYIEKNKNNSKNDIRIHCRLLRMIYQEIVSKDFIGNLMLSDKILERKYCGIFTKRFYSNDFDLINSGLELKDPDLKGFFKELQELNF